MWPGCRRSRRRGAGLNICRAPKATHSAQDPRRIGSSAAHGRSISALFSYAAHACPSRLALCETTSGTGTSLVLQHRRRMCAITARLQTKGAAGKKPRAGAAAHLLARAVQREGSGRGIVSQPTQAQCLSILEPCHLSLPSFTFPCLICLASVARGTDSLVEGCRRRTSMRLFIQPGAQMPPHPDMFPGQTLQLQGVSNRSSQETNVDTGPS